MAPACGSRSTAAAPVCPTRLTSHGLDRCTDAYDAAGQGNFESALRFGLNQPCKRPHLSLTALARVERWAGFYVHGHDAIGATASFTIVTNVESHALRTNLRFRRRASSMPIKGSVRTHKSARTFIHPYGLIHAADRSIVVGCVKASASTVHGRLHGLHNS